MRGSNFEGAHNRRGQTFFKETKGNVLVSVLVLVVVSGIVGVSVFFWQQTVLEEQRVAQQQEIDRLTYRLNKAETEGASLKQLVEKVRSESEQYATAQNAAKWELTQTQTKFEAAQEELQQVQNAYLKLVEKMKILEKDCLQLIVEKQQLANELSALKRGGVSPAESGS